MCRTHRGDEGLDRVPRYLKACLPFLIRLPPRPLVSPSGPFPFYAFTKASSSSSSSLCATTANKGSTRSAVTHSLAHGKWTYIVQDERFSLANTDDNDGRFLLHLFIINKKTKRNIFYRFPFFPIDCTCNRARLHICGNSVALVTCKARVAQIIL